MAEITKFRASFPTGGNPVKGKPGEGGTVTLEVPESDAEALRTLWRDGAAKVLLITVEEEQEGLFG